MEPKTALSIAGSDSGGGAGIQADVRTFAAFEIHATTAITAVTAQNTLGVQGVHNIAPSFVLEQIASVLDDFEVAAVKCGMLAQPATVEAVANLAREGRLANLVVDPVLVATSGDVLMQDGGVEAYRDALLPYAYVVTPNAREAALLSGVDERDLHHVDDMIRVAQIIASFGSTYVLLKGGHSVANVPSRTPDVLVGQGQTIVFDAERVATSNDHGTGCSLSAAIASGLAQQRNIVDATRDAKSFVLAALTSGATWRLGHGRGPIDHLGWNGE